MVDTNPNQLAQVQTQENHQAFDLVPASQFTVEQLTDIYNQTRVDYVVPMPMNTAKLKEYIHNYDIDLKRSAVAVKYGEPIALAMLGVRGGRTWITRLGVIPDKRQGGVGRGLMNTLIANSRALGAKTVVLEVIKNNIPAQRLFQELGFQPARELLVIRRPPAAMNISIGNGLYIDAAGYQEALAILEKRTGIASWVTANESLYNAGNLSALVVNLPKGGRGWLVYQNTVFQLSRVVLETEGDDTLKLAISLLQNLHWRHPVQDTIVENIPADDKYWPAFQKLGYIVSFTRIEMHLNLVQNNLDV